MTAVSSNLRSTKSITSFVELSDELATLAVRQKTAQRELAALIPEVLAQIGEGRAVKIGSQIRHLKPVTVSSVSRTCDDETAVEWCKENGLDFSTRTPNFVAPATFTKYVREGLMDPELYSTEDKTSVVVS